MLKKATFILVVILLCSHYLIVFTLWTINQKVEQIQLLLSNTSEINSEVHASTSESMERMANAIESWYLFRVQEARYINAIDLNSRALREASNSYDRFNRKMRKLGRGGP